MTYVNGQQPHTAKGNATFRDDINGVDSYTGDAVNAAVINAGDVVEFFTIQDTFSWMDNHVWFENGGKKVERILAAPGAEVNLTAKGVMNWYVLAVESDRATKTENIEDAALTSITFDETDGWREGTFSDYGSPIDISGADGKLTFTAPTALGTYYYSAYSYDDDYPMFSPWLEVKVANKYTVSFNANSGKLSGVASKDVFKTEPYGTLPTAARTGYTFAGWYTAASNGSNVTAATPVSINANQTLYAHWTVNNYTAKFNANGGKVSKASKQVTFDTKHGTLPVPSRRGYKFAGWHTSKSGGTKVTASTKVTSANDVTLHAHWTANKYTVKFNANGSKVSTASKKVTFNAKYGKLPTPKKTNKSFAGWYTKASGGKKVTSVSKVSSAKNITLYAHWTNKKVKVVNCSSVFVSSGPKSSSAKINSLNKGDTVEVISQSGNWYKIKSANGKISGWVYGKYLSK